MQLSTGNLEKGWLFRNNKKITTHVLKPQSGRVMAFLFMYPAVAIPKPDR